MTPYPSYREIQPATDPRHMLAGPRPSLRTSSETIIELSKRTQSPAALPKRRNATAACESCRKRKTKCSAERPRCTVCTAKGYECEYHVQPSESRISALKRTHAEMECRSGCLESILSAMRALPETQAHEILREIRSGTSFQDIVRQLEAEGPLSNVAPSSDVLVHELDEADAT